MDHACVWKFLKPSLVYRWMANGYLEVWTACFHPNSYQWGTVTVCSGLCGVAGSFITYWHRSRWPKYCNLVFQLFPILKFHDQRKECPCPDTVAEVPLCIHLISHGRSFMDIPFPVPHPSSLIYLTGHTVSWVQGISVYLQCLGYDLAVIWRHPLSQWIQMDLNYSILTHFE